MSVHELQQGSDLEITSLRFMVEHFPRPVDKVNTEPFLSVELSRFSMRRNFFTEGKAETMILDGVNEYSGVPGRIPIRTIDPHFGRDQTQYWANLGWRKFHFGLAETAADHCFFINRSFPSAKTISRIYDDHIWVLGNLLGWPAVAVLVRQIAVGLVFPVTGGSIFIQLCPFTALVGNGHIGKVSLLVLNHE